MTVFDMLIKNIAKLSFFFLLISILFQTNLVSNENLEIEIDNPKFSEKGLDNRLYEIKAEKGIQREGNLELFIVEGKLRTDSGVWIYLNAKKGNFDQVKNLIELNGEINFYTDEEDRFQSDNAFFSINDDIIEFNNNVKHIRGTNIITANESKIRSNFNHIVYKGNVNTSYIID
ncbi:LPS export ABC transporter periplasmic protein LptC [Pelagibacteraceae bacterium]|nr:LPS export ABC transporter periplasmic protein LptC [Pelagibacteraceae bacterium]